MEWLNAIVAGIMGIVGAFGGGSIIYWRATRKAKEAEAHKSTTDARTAEADFAQMILEKYEKGILNRMDSGDAVRKQEFEDINKKIDKRFDNIESRLVMVIEEDRKQNAALNSQNAVLNDIVEYLNGGFQQFEETKKRKTKKK